MQVTYQPDGQEPQTWTLRWRKLRSSEAELVERATGLTLSELGVAFLKGSMLAFRATIWMLLRRTQPSLKLAEVDLCADDVSVLWEADEADQIRKALTDTPDVDEQQRDWLLKTLEEGQVPAPEPAQPPPTDEAAPLGAAADAAN